jgi:hypothetical protein
MAPTKPRKASPVAPKVQPSAGFNFQYRNIAVAGLVFVAVWALAIASRSTGMMVFLGVLTVALVAFGVYTYRWYTRQKQLMEIAKRGIENPEARAAAIKELEAREKLDGDVTSALMRAQLELQEDPEKAMATLDAVDMKKVPAMMLNEVRGMKAQVYLVKNRAAEAAELADQIQLSQIQQPEVRSVMAATVAEAWARTGKVKQAHDLLGLFSPDDPAYAAARVPLLYARIFTFFADGKRDLARKDMVALCRENFQYLGRFMMPNSGVRPELVQMAQEVIQRDDNARKAILEMQGQGGAPRLNRAQRRAAQR